LKMVQEVKKVSTNVVLCVCCDGERRRGLPRLVGGGSALLFFCIFWFY
jgi:hypothetical protein